MNSLVFAIITATALSATTQFAWAQNDTDKALGAGSYLHPNGPENGVWGPLAVAKPAGHEASRHRRVHSDADRG